MFCAMNAPLDNCYTAVDYVNYEISGMLGPTAEKDDGLRIGFTGLKRTIRVASSLAAGGTATRLSGTTTAKHTPAQWTALMSGLRSR